MASDRSNSSNTAPKNLDETAIGPLDGDKLVENFVAVPEMCMGDSGVGEQRCSLLGQLTNELKTAVGACFDKLYWGDACSHGPERYQKEMERICHIVKAYRRCAACLLEVPTQSLHVATSGQKLMILGAEAARRSLCLCKVVNQTAAADDSASLMLICCELLRESRGFLDELLRCADVLEQCCAGNEDGVEPLCTVLSDLAHCAHEAGAFDVKLMVAVHKFIVRVSSKHKQSCCRWASAKGVLAAFEQSIRDSSDALLACDMQAAEDSKGIKLLAFQVKVMCRVADDFALQDDTLSSVLNAAIAVHRLFLLFDDGSTVILSGFTSCIREHLLPPVTELLMVLAGRTTMSAAVCAHLANYDHHSRAVFKLYMALLEIIEACPEPVQCSWIVEDDSNVLLSLLSHLEKCHVELGLLTVQGECKIGRMLDKTSTLFELSCFRVCSLIINLPSCAFPAVEKWLFQCLVSDHPYCNLLAIDVWALLARSCFSPELVHTHCCLLADLHLLVTDATATQISLALLQLLSILPSDYQTSFLCKYSTLQYMNVWLAVPASAWARTQPMLETALNNVMSLAENEWESPKATAGTCTISACVASLVDGLGCCVRADGSDVKDGSAEGIRHCHIPANLAGRLWQRLASPVTLSTSRLKSRKGAALVGMLDCASPVMLELSNKNNASSSSMAEALSLCSELLGEQSTCCGRLAVCHFLESLADLVIRPTVEQSKVFTRISDLFSRAINSCDVAFVKLAALQAFKVFAERTPHADIVAGTTEQKDLVRDAVVQYISLDEGCKPADSELVEQFRAQFVMGLRSSSAKTSCLRPGPTLPADGSSPLKRRRMNDADDVLPTSHAQVDSNLHTIVDLMHHACSRVRSSNRGSITRADLDEVISACRSLVDACVSRMASKEDKDVCIS